MADFRALPCCQTNYSDLFNLTSGTGGGGLHSPPRVCTCCKLTGTDSGTYGFKKKFPYFFFGDTRIYYKIQKKTIIISENKKNQLLKRKKN